MLVKRRFARFQALAALALVFVLVLFSGRAAAESWTFAAIADSRAEVSLLRNVLEEVRDMKAQASPRIPRIGIVIALGDIDPAAQTWKVYREIFPANDPPFFPVRGNHELAADVRVILEDILPPLAPAVKLHDARSVNYLFDWKNARFIVIDPYAEFGRNPSNPALLKWVEEAIVSARDARHIFICLHEPYIPHDPVNDPFWGLLLRHNDKVRAVLAGHTHRYNRRRIPDTPGGIYSVNAGNAGQTNHSDGKQTLLEVTLDETRVSFRAVQAPAATKKFSVEDRFQITVPAFSKP